MHAEIISIGTEILMGEIVDTNSGYLAAELAKIGVEVRWVTKVGDEPKRLCEAIERGWNRSDVTITTGGLGPTSDDLTRESIATVMAEDMLVQDDLLADLKNHFELRGIPMPSTNVKQATLIESARPLSNPLGTAPGWWVKRGNRVIVALPGPPRELSRMWDKEVEPELRGLNPGSAIVTRTLKTFGISEGGLDELLSHLFQNVNPSLGIYSKQDGIHLRAIATGSTRSKAQGLIDPIESEIRSIVGSSIWGVDHETAESQTIDALRKNCLSLGIIDGFTGGLLVSNLSQAPVYSELVLGSIIATDGTALNRQDVPCEMLLDWDSPTPMMAEVLAKSARKIFDTHVGVGITGPVRLATQESGSDGTVHMAIAVGQTVTTRTNNYPIGQLRVRNRAVTQTLLELISVLQLDRQNMAVPPQSG